MITAIMAVIAAATITKWMMKTFVRMERRRRREADKRRRAERILQRSY